MVDYNLLFEKGYLKGVNADSPISLLGTEKLASIFKNKYNFIDIKIIKESEILDEFNMFNNITKGYVDKFSFINDKLKKFEFTSEEQDKLFYQLKSFNRKYKIFEPNSEELFSEISSNYDTLISLLEFNNEKERLLDDIMCKIILRAKKEKVLNFFIWVDSEERHYSLVFNVFDNYLFFDSCSIFFQRWPSRKIISYKKEDNLFESDKTMVMMSFLQTDSYNCVSFVFAFIDIFINLHQKSNTKELLKYLSKYFDTLYDGLFYVESGCNKYPNLYENDLYLLPQEFLYLTEKIEMLEGLKVSLTNEKNKVIVEEVIEQVKNQKKIIMYRKCHLEDLMKL